MKWMKINTVRLIFILFLCLVAIPSFVSIVCLIGMNIDSTYQAIEFSAKTVLDDIDLLLENQIGESDEYVRVLYGRNMLEILGDQRYRYQRYEEVERRNEIEGYLSLIRHQSQFITGIYVITANGNLFYSSDYPINPHHEELSGYLLSSFAESSLPLVIGMHRPWFAASDKASVFSLCRSLYQMDGNLAAIVIIDISTGIFDSILSRLVSETSSSYILTDESGSILASDCNDIVIEEELASLISSGAMEMDHFQTIRIGEHRMHVFCTESFIVDWRLVSITPASSIMKALLPSILIGVILLILLFFCSVLFIWIADRRIIRPLRQLQNGMKAVDAGNLGIRINGYRDDEFGQTIENFNAMTERLDGLVKEKCESIILMKEMEYKELKWRINPHFMLNSLQLISSNAIMREDRVTEAMVNDLSRMLRYALYDDDMLVPFEKELEHIEAYVSFLRKAEGEDVGLILPSDKDVKKAIIPKMILQPIIENSFFHGFNASGLRSILIKSRIQRNHLLIAVFDNGGGISPERGIAIRNHIRCSADSDVRGIGLANVAKRLKSVFGMDSWLDIRSLKGKGTVVIMSIPQGSE